MTQHVIRVVDFETNGTEPPAEVVEVGWCDLTHQGNGFWTVGEWTARLHGVSAIPPETRAVHHISPQEVAGLPPFDAAAFMEDSDHCAAFAAHNAAFEEQWLKIDGIMPLICTYKAALRVWPDAPAHSNSVLRYWLQDQGAMEGMEHEKSMPPHRAGPDAYVTAWILRALLTHCTGKEMVAWTREPKAFPTCPIGKERGKKWADVDTGFLTWMTNQASMEADLKWNAQRELDRRRAA